MACPFARYASSASIHVDHASPFSSTSTSSSRSATPPATAFSSSSSFSLSSASSVSLSHAPRLVDFADEPTLCAHLKQGAHAIHKAVERSPGVRALLAAASAPSTPIRTRFNIGDDDPIRLRRLDYVRWLIIMAAVYAALESPLHTLQQASLSSEGNIPSILRPFLEAQNPDADRASPSGSSSLLHALTRLPAVLNDLSVHMDEVIEEEGVNATALAQADADAAFTSLRDRQEHEQVCRELHSLLRPRLQHVLETMGRSRGQAGSPTASRKIHFDLPIEILHPVQAIATLEHVRRLVTLEKSSSSDASLFLSHIYVRYLGDLSGGQHILRRMMSKWPLTSADQSNDGFDFYTFRWQDGATPAVPQSDVASIKAVLRESIDEGLEQACHDEGIRCLHSDLQASADLHSRLLVHRTLLCKVVLRETKLSFLLNRRLFDALVPSVGLVDDIAMYESGDEIAARESPSSDVTRPSTVPVTSPTDVSPIGRKLLPNVASPAMESSQNRFRQLNVATLSNQRVVRLVVSIAALCAALWLRSSSSALVESAAQATTS